MLAAALAYLEEWVGEMSDPDPEQRSWKQAYGEGAVMAYERLGLLSPADAERWRARFVAPDNVASQQAAPSLGVNASVAAGAHLEALLADVVPLRRQPDDRALQHGIECMTAIEALHAVGALDAGAYEYWRGELLAKQAPWLDHESLRTPDGGVVYAVPVPPENEEEAAADALRAAQLAARPEAREVQRVVVGSPNRQSGIAIVAVVVYEDATTVHFHYLGDPQGDSADGFASLDAFTATLERLEPPDIQDDVGTVYEHIGPERRPNSAGGAGGIPDPNRRESITGLWLYTPDAPASASRFTLRLGAAEWVLPGQ